MKKKNEKGSAKAIIIVVGSVLLFLFLVVVFAGGVARFYFEDSSLTLVSLVKRIMGGEAIIQPGSSSMEIAKFSNEKGEIELGIKDKNQKLDISAFDKTQWPKGATGGLYEIQPSGEFKNPVDFKMTLKESAPTDFALGYWHSDTKKWEWLPTAKRSDKVFQTILPHASIIGGGSGGACSSMPKGQENIQMYNEIKAGLSGVQIDQQTGEAAEINDASWKPIWENAKEMTDKAINDYCKNRDLNTEYDFYAAWELVQCLGFQSLNDRFEAAWENKCEEKEKKREYKIDQSDDYSSQFHLDLGPFYKQNTNFNATISYIGNSQGVATKGKPSWRTNWKVRSFVDSKGVANQTGHIENERGYYDLKALNTNLKTTDNYEFTFSLDNVKEGESFQVRQVRSGAYISRSSGPDAHIVFKSGDGVIHSTGSMNNTTTIDPGASFTLSAVLLKDMGDDGAIIAFSNEMQLTPEQKKAFESVMELQREGGLPQIWDAPGKVNSNIMQTQGKMKPWRIVPVGIENENDPDDDWKSNESDLSNQKNRQSKNPNDKNGDGIPDLVPLPGN